MTQMVLSSIVPSLEGSSCHLCMDTGFTIEVPRLIWYAIEPCDEFVMDHHLEHILSRVSKSFMGEIKGWCSSEGSTIIWLGGCIPLGYVQEI